MKENVTNNINFLFKTAKNINRKVITLNLIFTEREVRTRFDLIDNDVQQEDTLKDKYLTFLIGDNSYGVEVRHVTEIVGMHPIVGMPETPAYVKGIINLRGKIFPVIDARLRLNLAPKEYDERTCIIVLNINNQTFGLIVDAVAEVANIPEKDMTAPSDAGINNSFVKSIAKIGNAVKLLMDCEKIFQ